MLLLRLSGWLFLLLLLATAAATLLGTQLPATRTITASATLPATPADLWPLLTTPAAQPRWRPDVTATAPLPDANCWTELHGHLAIPVCITASNPPHTLTLRSADTGRSFTLVAITPTSTNVTLTETSTTTQPLVRLREHYLPPSTNSPDAELAALAEAAATQP